MIYTRELKKAWLRKSLSGHRGTGRSPVSLTLPMTSLYTCWKMHLSSQPLRGVIMRADSVLELIGTVGVSGKRRLKIVH